MSKIIKLIKNFDYYIQYLLFAMMIFGVTLQILYRTIPGLKIPWANEFVAFTFGASIWLGISVAIEENSHLNIDLAIKNFSNKTQRKFKIFHLLLFLIYILIILWLGYQAIKFYYVNGAVSVSMEIPYYILRSPLIVGCIYSIYRLIKKLMFILNSKEEFIQS